MKTPWEVLQLYVNHGGTLPGLLASRARREPGRPFLLFQDQTWTWERCEAAVSRAAAALAGCGLGQGDKLAVMAPNSDAYVIVFLALARMGAILVPVSHELGPAEAGYIFQHAEVPAVACTPGTLPVARRACDGMAKPPWLMLIEGVAEGVPSFPALCDATREAPPSRRVGPEDICLIMYTSGTTGFPKGVMHSHRNVVMAGEGFVERMYLQPDDRLLCILPLCHINALFYSLGGTLAAGASIVLAPRFSASGFWPLAARTGATEVNVLAAVGSILARRPRTEFVAGHRLGKVYGAPITAEAAAAFRNEFGVTTLIEGYGMTEVPGACNNPFPGPHKPGSIGRAARHPDHCIPFAELRVVDEAGRDVPDGETGELLVRTPIVMKGYYRDPAQTAAAFRDGWFITGDLVRRDPDGFYYFVARKKDIIRRRGENVAGAELDRVVGMHPGVAEAAAIGVPSDLGEEDILVAVVRRAGAALTAGDIGRWCAEHLAPAKVPRYVVFLDTLPHTPTHRVAKFPLKDDAAALLARAVDLQQAVPEATPPEFRP
jgi:crotonobetaine/carnitine-CoA ligase